MLFIPIYAYFIFLSFLVSLSIYFKKSPNFSYLKFFPLFLLLTLFAEVYGSYLSYSNQRNIEFYNFFTVLEFCFYLIILRLIIKNKNIRKIIVITTILYVIAAIVNISFYQGKNSFHTITYSIGCLIVVSFCIYFFLELFRLPKSIKLSRNPAFWICSGLLFFYCCGFPLYAFINFWSHLEWIIKRFDDIVTILNTFLYTLFTIAFLCNRTRKYTLSL
jgi:hypothetical protein